MAAVTVCDRQIAGRGTPEADWAAWPGWADVAATDPLAWAPPGGRVLVVAPHPDDEVLGCGGALALLAAAGRPVVLVAVTDGEASHPDSARWTPVELAALRRHERRSGLARLGLAAAEVVCLGLPDGAVAARQAELTDRLSALLRPADTVLATWRFDGHPDHEATGRAAAAACARHRHPLIEIPVWMWHWAAPGDARVPWPRLRQLALTADALARKRAAIAEHRSQWVPEAARDAPPPVLPDWALARLLRPVEAVFLPG
jgi:LmbE family N-acetylglucosaminyl deacetylase